MRIVGFEFAKLRELVGSVANAESRGEIQSSEGRLGEAASRSSSDMTPWHGVEFPEGASRAQLSQNRIADAAVCNRFENGSRFKILET